jgi:hypothetical protein
MAENPDAPQASAPIIQGITPPKALDITHGNIAENWKNYKQVWHNYAIITNLKAQTEQYRVALFLHCIGPEALKVYNGMQFADETERNTLASIHKKFDEFTIGEVNKTYERYIFNGRNQGQDESIEAYIAALRSLAKTCGFCECLADSLLRDRIVLGIHNNSLRKRLLQERNLDLKKCIDLCRSSEAAASHLKNISGSNNTIHDVNKVHEHAGRNVKPVRQQNYDRNARNDGNKKQAITAIDCKFCGRNHPRKKEHCPAWQKRCQKCNGRNHFAAVCGKTISCGGVNYVSEQRDDSSDDSSEYEFLAGITEEPVINAVKRLVSPKKFTLK